jgi:hypothetical protein
MFRLAALYPKDDFWYLCYRLSRPQGHNATAAGTETHDLSACSVMSHATVLPDCQWKAYDRNQYVLQETRIFTDQQFGVQEKK